MTLLAHISKRIATQGPLRLDDYMATCLLHPTMGYYTTRMPFGAAGDFTTAPEISQMFGELVGLCLAQSWQDNGRPAPFTLAELGPGRGTLMADILRATNKVPGFLDAADVVLLEASENLRRLQAATLAPTPLSWINQTEMLPAQPLYLVANEFFDALPIRQFQRAGTQWRERQVGLIDQKLAFGLGPAQPQPTLSERLVDTQDGDIVEVCEALPALLSPISARLDQFGGATLIIDYGDWRSQGSTFQALEKHAAADPLAHPGQVDLTAHVDFEALARGAAPAQHTKVTPQGVFLERLGITARAQHLARSLNGAALAEHVAAHRRLTHPEEMGNLFKVLGLYQTGAAPPAGLEP